VRQIACAYIDEFGSVGDPIELYKMIAHTVELPVPPITRIDYELKDV
jgi:hypothetical protein